MHTNIYTYIYSCKHTCMHTYINIYIYIYTYVYTFIHARIHTCIHTVIHAYIETCFYLLQYTNIAKNIIGLGTMESFYKGKLTTVLFMFEYALLGVLLCT